jgi:hypothetical protein
MANRWAVATGNWSDTATWNGGTLPAADDDVFSGGFTVTIDQDVTVLSLRNAAASGITVGGGFTLTGNHAVTCTGIGLEANAVNLLTYDGTGTANIDALLVFTTATTANVAVVTHSGTGALNVTSPADIVGGNAASRLPINFTSAGTLNITASVQSATSAAVTTSGGGALTIVGDVTAVGAVLAVSVLTAPDGFVTVVGNVTAGTSGNGITLGTSTARTTVNVTGNVTGGTGSGGVGIFPGSGTGGSTITVVGNVASGAGGSANGISGAAGVNVTVTGDLTAGTGTGQTVVGSFATFDFTGTFTASSEQNAFANQNSGAINYIRGTAINNGPVMALNLARMTWGTLGDENLNSGLNTWTFFNQLNSPRIMYRPDQFDEFPAATDVALGVSYGPNDEIVGTLVSTPTPEAVAGAVWGYARTGATTSGSMGERLKDAATVATTGGQIAGFGE